MSASPFAAAVGRQLSIGIVGAGTAGLASALFLGRDLKHSVTVFEQTSTADLEAPVGACIGIQPIGLTVLKHLGLLEQTVNKGARIDHLLCQTVNDRTVLDLKYADFRPQLFGLGLHREVRH